MRVIISMATLEPKAEETLAELARRARASTYCRNVSAPARGRVPGQRRRSLQGECHNVYSVGRLRFDSLFHGQVIIRTLGFVL